MKTNITILAICVAGVAGVGMGYKIGYNKCDKELQPRIKHLDRRLKRLERGEIIH